MDELRERILNAIGVLTAIRDEKRINSYPDQWAHDEIQRLKAKISGLSLALSYLDEEIEKHTPVNQDEESDYWLGYNTGYDVGMKSGGR